MRARIARRLRRLADRLHWETTPPCHLFTSSAQISYHLALKPKPFVPRESWRSEQIGLGVERCPAPTASETAAH